MDKTVRGFLGLLCGDVGEGFAPVGEDRSAAGSWSPVPGVEGGQAGPGAVLEAGEDGGEAEAGPHGGVENCLPGFGG
jgi:hypothetical protein